MQTSVTRFLGIQDPIVQAPIGGLSNPRLAAAVSNAGGLGMIAMSWMDPDEMREAIRATRVLTSEPFGINLIIDESRDEQLAAALEMGVKVISFFWGDPAPYLAAVHDAGAVALLTVGSAAEARAAVDAGVDVIVAQGWEAGGHVWGEVSTLVLVPAVIDAVGDVPVIAAGGIADGRGLAAVLALGAGAAWMGTRFVASEEAPAHPDYIERVIAADETATFHSKLFDIGWPDAAHRVLRNGTVDAWISAGRPPSGKRPGEGEVIAQREGTDFVRYSSVSPRVGTTGNVADLSLWAGQGVGLVHQVLPAAQIVHRTVSEAEAILGRLASAGWSGGYRPGARRETKVTAGSVEVSGTA
jgi:NAD(P)H-dependent flavin oxidoreductase YrpB (nitropropane dioxygenase family)